MRNPSQHMLALQHACSPPRLLLYSICSSHQ